VKPLTSFNCKKSKITAMKKFRFYIPAALMVLVLSCKKDNIDTYGSGAYIQFVRSFSDSSLFSFLGLPDEDEATVPIPVQIAGVPSDKDRTYKISVMSPQTTANTDNYIIPASFTLRANKVVDTGWITVKKTPDISVKPVKLVLKMEKTNDFEVGQTDHSVFILYISNIVARPDWWDGNVEGRFLGSYSDKKLLLFIEVTGRSNLDPQNEDEIRYYTIIFKNYLLREKDQGRTVYEDNGSEMTVALIGG
jgi:hypothetical protein